MDQNLGYRLTKAASSAVGIFALLSIPSAYLFGLTAIFPASIRTLVDYRFFANELLAFVVFLAGISGVARIQVSYGRLVYFRFIDPADNVIFGMSSFRITFRRWIGWLLILVFLSGLFLLVSLVASNLYEPRFLFEWFLLVFLCILPAIFVVSYTNNPFAPIGSSIAELFRFVQSNPSKMLENSASISLIVGISLLSSYSLGSARIKSLAAARDVCVELVDEIVIGKILGESNSGIFIKIGELELSSYFDLSSRFKRFTDPRHQVIFVSRDRVVTIDPFCAQDHKALLTED